MLLLKKNIKMKDITSDIKKNTLSARCFHKPPFMETSWMMMGQGRYNRATPAPLPVGSNAYMSSIYSSLRFNTTSLLLFAAIG
jgi:hypothetical protein